MAKTKVLKVKKHISGDANRGNKHLSGNLKIEQSYGKPQTTPTVRKDHA